MIFGEQSRQAGRLRRRASFWRTVFCAGAANPTEAVKAPRTWYVSSDTLHHFLYYNDLKEVIEQKYKSVEQIREEYPNIIQIFKNSFFPPEIIKGFALALDDFGDRPIIVRSSSLLEDRIGAAFSGKYKSLFLANQGTREERLSALMDAVARGVFASTFGPDPSNTARSAACWTFMREDGRSSFSGG
jgi:hypothetical protein